MTELKYRQGKIYTLRSSETEVCYVGSTIEPLNERMRKHYVDFNRWILGKRDCITSFELLKFVVNV